MPKIVLRVYLKYGPEGESVIRNIDRASRPGRRLYRGYTQLQAGPGRPGHRHPQHQPGVMSDRQARANGSAANCSAPCGKRHPCTVATNRYEQESTMSRIGKQPVVVPAGVKVQHRRRQGPRRRPQGQAGTAPHPAMKVEHRRQGRKAIKVDAARRRAPQPVAARPDAQPDRQHGRGRHQGLREDGSRSKASATRPAWTRRRWC